MTAKMSLNDARGVLEWFVRHTKLLSGRWPCPYCGRQDNMAPLVAITVTRSDGVTQTEGCWYCNMEPLIARAEAVLAGRVMEPAPISPELGEIYARSLQYATPKKVKGTLPRKAKQ